MSRCNPPGSESEQWNQHSEGHRELFVATIVLSVIMLMKQRMGLMSHLLQREKR
jgi:hypothetical protein